MSFVDLFAADVEPPEPPEPPAVPERPEWLGPPEGELGVAVPLGLVIGRGERGVVALSHALVHSTGISLDVVAHVGGLEPRQASTLFHEQHAVNPDPGDVPDGFLRFGIELHDGARVSNLGGRRPWGRPEDGPRGPVLTHHGGGGGQSSGTSIAWNARFWLWPLPPAGTLRVHCEWPVADIALTTLDLDGTPLLEAAASATRIWEGESRGASARSSVSQFVMSSRQEVAAEPGDETVAVPVGELRSAQEALQSALRTLRRLGAR